MFGKLETAIKDIETKWLGIEEKIETAVKAEVAKVESTYAADIASLKADIAELKTKASTPVSLSDIH